MKYSLSILCLGLAALMAAACTTPPPNFKHAQYWQRVDASEAAYLQGPKVQQMLNRDLARCVYQIRELERLGSLKDAIPTDHQGRLLDPDQRTLYDWDTPEYQQYLRAEHGDFHDFDTCMKDKGWERTKYVPFEVAARAEDNYIRAHVRYEAPEAAEKKHTKKTTSQKHGDYSNLND